MEKHHRNYDLNFFLNLWKIQKALTDVDVNKIALRAIHLIYLTTVICIELFGFLKLIKKKGYESLK